MQRTAPAVQRNASPPQARLPSDEGSLSSTQNFVIDLRFLSPISRFARPFYVFPSSIRALAIFFWVFLSRDRAFPIFFFEFLSSITAFGRSLSDFSVHCE